jgi:SAM-dependent methyltransferase
MDRTIELLIELHEGLDRLGPGTAEATAQALALCAGLPAEPAVLDVGCGTGASTLELARRTNGRITAVDLAPSTLATLRARAAAAGLADRIETVPADMADLPFADASFDLVWSEGAIYMLGFAAGLRAWRPLLRPGGWLAATELSWLATPPPEAAAWWAVEYPGMGSVEQNRAVAEAAGFRVAQTFALPAEAWTEGYYAPLRARLEPLLAAHPDDPIATAVVEATRAEMELFDRFGDAYGYVFYVLQRA